MTGRRIFNHRSTSFIAAPKRLTRAQSVVDRHSIDHNLTFVPTLGILNTAPCSRKTTIVDTSGLGTHHGHEWKRIERKNTNARMWDHGEMMPRRRAVTTSHVTFHRKAIFRSEQSSPRLSPRKMSPAMSPKMSPKMPRWYERERRTAGERTPPKMHPYYEEQQQHSGKIYMKKGVNGIPLFRLKLLAKLIRSI